MCVRAWFGGPCVLIRGSINPGDSADFDRYVWMINSRYWCDSFDLDCVQTVISKLHWPVSMCVRAWFGGPWVLIQGSMNPSEGADFVRYVWMMNSRYWWDSFDLVCVQTVISNLRRPVSICVRAWFVGPWVLIWGPINAGEYVDIDLDIWRMNSRYWWDSFDLDWVRS